MGTLRAAKGVRRDAARALRIAPSTLYGMIGRLRLWPDVDKIAAEFLAEHGRRMAGRRRKVKT